MEVERFIDVWIILFMINNQVHCFYTVKKADGDHGHDAFVRQSIHLLFFSSRTSIDLFVFLLAEGCLQPLPDQIDHGWKSAESYVIYQDIKYYVLTRYSCHKDAKLVDSSSTVIDIQCQKNEWEQKVLPKCQMVEEKNP